MPTIDLNGTPTYQGEVLLLGWSENNRDGMVVRFALNGAEEGDVHPFRGLGTGKHGQRFMVVAVPIDEQNEGSEAGTAFPGTVNPSAGGEDGDKPRRKFEDMSPSQQAGMLCADAEFYAFLSQRYKSNFSGSAADFVRHWCGVSTRKQLNDETGPQEIWNRLASSFRAWRTDKRYEEMRL